MTPTKNEYFNHYYDTKYDCSAYGITCDDKRIKAKEYTRKYYVQAAKEVQIHGSSCLDPRPAGHDRYVDYLSDSTVPIRPSHGYYGKLPYTTIRDPSCNELQELVQGVCNSEVGQPGGYGMGQVCGLGTTWDPTRKQCVRMGGDYMTIDGTGQPYERPIYPNIRPYNSTTCYDNPNDVYIYLNPQEEQVYNSCPHGRLLSSTSTSLNGHCSADRCRFPLTSDQGRTQAKLYVNLFRAVYEYRGRDRNKNVRRERMHQLIDDHRLYFGRGTHDNGDFLPWHRWYILEMETILMQHQAETVSPNDVTEKFIGIPYWDWHNLKESAEEFINNANDPLGHNFNDSLGQGTLPRRFACINDGALEGFVLTTGRCLRRAWRSDFNPEQDPQINLHPLFTEPSQYDQFRQLSFGFVFYKLELLFFQYEIGCNKSATQLQL